MKILLVAPKICSPWTEGRKQFVRDLSDVLGSEHQLEVLTTVDRGQTTFFHVPFQALSVNFAVAHLIKLHRSLKKKIIRFHPDLVCHFPFGVFHGKYRLANLWSMWTIDDICHRRGLPCFTLMYAIASESSVLAIDSWVRHLFINQFSDLECSKIRFGRQFSPSVDWLPPISFREKKSLLFMAGMWEKTQERLAHVLELRGLSTLLQAGGQLGSLGFQLVVAVPLLSDPVLRDQVMKSADNKWPDGSLKLVGEKPVMEIFSKTDFFVFPYAREETVFTPTSLVEAMYYGIPVVVPKLKYLTGLCGDESNSRAFLYEPGDEADLAETIRKAAFNHQAYCQVRDAASLFVRSKLNIQGTKEDILKEYRKISNHI